MIDKVLEPYYDIILSIFFGIMIILILHNMYDSPRIIIIDQTSKSESGSVSRSKPLHFQNNM
jgi:hypothetical protein